MQQIEKQQELETMKIINVSEPSLGSSMNEDETRNFLSNGKLFARLGTVDKKDEPNVHPVWYHFENDKIYFETGKNSKKALNIEYKSTVYFCIDDTTEPYKGVRGKGVATFVNNTQKNLSIVEKLLLKYTGSLDNEIAKYLIDTTKTGESIMVEITPRFFGTWDHGKK